MIYDNLFRFPAWIGNDKSNEKLLKLINDGSDVNEPITMMGSQTALHFACYGNATLNTVKLLIENGADVNKLDSESRTPFYLAVTP